MAEFEDGKDQGALRTIGELGEALGIKTHVLRYWEDQFPQLKPLKRSGGRRYYRPEDVALVREIDRLVNRDGYTLRGARTALKDFGSAVEAPVEAPPAPATLFEPSGRAESPAAETVSPEVIARLRAIRTRLAEALTA
ncbi:MerR family transcriptional regulator [Parafrankia sp. BMG5.11]|uniref:MerR family transcriptional regulator n=1 Tax=Parafrankia sp. BMG5.11 TaxID=222540 RepID=UPI001040353F|nr:MerR family transcriptional regulator [Parafrankia sp. BMG5.11]TCJ37194.1 MerR family transcriptional regulator [Parafrankia sp. BMG5.11]